MGNFFWQLGLKLVRHNFNLIVDDQNWSNPVPIPTYLKIHSVVEDKDYKRNDFSKTAVVELEATWSQWGSKISGSKAKVEEDKP